MPPSPPEAIGFFMSSVSYFQPVHVVLHGEHIELKDSHIPGPVSCRGHGL